ncbi:MAG TPA: hypothetical protein EYP10_09480 [Armatimonadetes bacterium]|nr:hypothetical protein [Armatimonadota bacterium]
MLREPAKKEMILRSGVGNLRYSTGALQGLWPRAVDGRYGGGTHPQSSLTGITQLLRRLTLVVDGFEDALRDPGLKDEVAKQLPLLNQTYGALLLKLHAELLAQKDDLISAASARPFLDFDGANKYIPIYKSRDTYEWVTAQHALIQRMEGIQDETTRQWNRDLIKWSGDHKKDDVWLVKAIDITLLLEEAQAVAPDIVERSNLEDWFV